MISQSPAPFMSFNHIFIYYFELRHNENYAQLRSYKEKLFNSLSVGDHAWSMDVLEISGRWEVDEITKSEYQEKEGGMPLATDVEWWTQYSHDSKRDESSTSVSRKMKHVTKESKYEAMTSSARNASPLKKNRRLPSVVVNPSPSETSSAERNVGEKTKPKGVALSSSTRVEHFLDVVIGNKNVHGMRDI
ncbi:unnamed protein product [Prunus armeniaca]